MADAAKHWVLFAISVYIGVFTSVIQSQRFTNDYEFGISVYVIKQKWRLNVK